MDKTIQRCREALAMLAQDGDMCHWTDAHTLALKDAVAVYAAERTDAERYRWLVRHASLGFDAAPSWNAVVRLPVFDSDDQTITALVDRARAAVGAA